MKNAFNEVSTLAEKVLDQNIKGENLEVLGLVVPSSLEEVGLYGLAASFAQGAKIINDHLFTRAFEKFSDELKYLTPDQKMEFYNKHSKKKIQEFGEQAILVLNKIEMPLAAKMIGRAHYLLVLDEIDETTYFNYCHVSKNLNYYLFENLRAVYESLDEKIFKGGVFSLMEGLGLMFEIHEGTFASAAADENNPQAKVTRYMRTEFGSGFYKNIIEPFI